MTLLSRVGAIAPLFTCFIVFFSSNALSEGGISWNFEAAEEISERKVLTNEVEMTDVKPNPSKSLSVNALTNEEFSFDVQGSFSEISANSSVGTIDLPTAEEQKVGELSSYSTAHQRGETEPVSSNKTIETGAATAHAAIDVNAVEDAEVDTHQDDAAKSVSLGSDLAENSKSPRDEPLKSDVALSGEQVSLIMHAFDGRTRPAARPPQHPNLVHQLR